MRRDDVEERECVRRWFEEEVAPRLRRLRIRVPHHRGNKEVQVATKRKAPKRVERIQIGRRRLTRDEALVLYRQLGTHLFPGPDVVVPPVRVTVAHGEDGASGGSFFDEVFKVQFAEEPGGRMRMREALDAMTRVLGSSIGTNVLDGTVYVGIRKRRSK